MALNYFVKISASDTIIFWIILKRPILVSRIRIERIISAINGLLGKLRSNHVRRKPMFEINSWSMHTRTTQSSMSTNNSTEAYHRRINAIFQCAHPTLWLFLQKLIDEESAVHADLVHINAGQPPKKKKTNDRLERCLVNLLTTSHDQVLVQLDSIAYNISL